MYTIWAAERMFAEKSYGSIETGKLADLVVTDRDGSHLPRGRHRGIQPAMTVLDGKIVKGLELESDAWHPGHPGPLRFRAW